ncbi:MAG: adenylate kinase [Elusimicrobia bacterium RIFCSPLOWO2_01_FULL_54_10]|nr:MAG: adenylate kinase [Elusimicrobia bacterium RIFCSPLOWO2_01_FULL_54_10]
MKLAILGPPGSGKGTQSTKLAHRLGIKHISTGDILRTAVKDKTPLGKKAHEFINSGQLVPDELMIGIVKERIAEKDCKNGFILDGFPRTIPQAQMLDKNIALDQVIFFDVSEEECSRRLSSRQICTQCGQIYNPTTRPPLRAGKCDKCKGPLATREDDKPETVKKRLKVYREQTEPVVEFYKQSERLSVMGKSGTPDEIFEYLVNLVESHERGRAAGRA